MVLPRALSEFERVLADNQSCFFRVFFFYGSDHVAGCYGIVGLLRGLS